MDYSAELRRLLEGPEPGQKPEVSVEVVVARCGGNADQVLERCREVLRIVLSQDPDQWPSDEAWRSLIPSWFVEQCAPEMTREEAESYVVYWRRLPWEERRRLAAEEKWSLLNWLYWFLPSERLWAWWNGVVEDPDTLYVGIADAEIPHGGGPVDWLLRACGATKVDELPAGEYSRVLPMLEGSAPRHHD